MTSNHQVAGSNPAEIAMATNIAMFNTWFIDLYGNFDFQLMPHQVRAGWPGLSAIAIAMNLDGKFSLFGLPCKITVLQTPPTKKHRIMKANAESWTEDLFSEL